jgi:iron complex transport system substrate-binding protein
MPFRRRDCWFRAALISSATLTVFLTACSSGSTSAVSAAKPSSRGSTPGLARISAPGNGAANAGAPPSCPPPPKLSAPPRRVVTMDAGAAAVLVELGLGDRIVGTAAPAFEAAFSGAMASELKSVKVIAPGRGTKEAVLAAAPDFVTGVSVYELGSFDGTPTAAMLEQNGISAYVACDSRGGTVTGIAETYSYIQNIASLFQVPAKGRALIASLQRQIAAAAAPAGNVGVLALSAAPDGGQGVHTEGGASLANGIITLAGGKNIAAGVGSQFATVSAETVTGDNPKVIVAITGLTSQRPAQLVAAIESSPLLAGTDAVKNKMIVTVPQTILLSPSLLNANAVVTIARAVAAAR